MDTFTRAYIEAALWSSMDDEGEPLDRKYSLEDIAPEALAKMQEDCAKFQETFQDDLSEAYSGLYISESAAGSSGDPRSPSYWSRNVRKAQYSEEYAGHDFWLTRNGHGAGFWDRGLEKLGNRLTRAAHSFREEDLYVGDDGKLYV